MYSPTKKVRVLVVDDSIFFRKVLIDNLSKEAGIEIAGYAINAFDAKKKIPQILPDVITMDVEMPGMNGIEFLKQLIPQNPIPVILVSSLNLSVFEALSAGAVDFVRKPDAAKASSLPAFIYDLARKIRIASNAKVRVSPTQSPQKTPQAPAGLLGPSSKLDNTIIAIGASTGGTEATLCVLKDLPADTPGMVIVQHMPPGFTKMYAERLDRICQMTVREAKSGDKICRGQALIAPGDLQMKVVRVGGQYAVNCYDGEKVSGHKPSVDVLFNSMAENVKCSTIGIILTGMGRDGAAGMCKMRQSGAYTIGQNKESCVVYGMPMVAYEMGGVAIQASCEGIPNVLLQKLRTMK
ncbi:MAG: chemotaxis response regulator protein-glutamate methylesterase [Firmicutes bacterium]|nr:chemotaxis response regulator protein-glutamate methylesterase [Bacillota bacterium]